MGGRKENSNGRKRENNEKEDSVQHCNERGDGYSQKRQNYEKGN